MSPRYRHYKKAWHRYQPHEHAILKRFRAMPPVSRKTGRRIAKFAIFAFPTKGACKTVMYRVADQFEHISQLEENGRTYKFWWHVIWLSVVVTAQLVSYVRHNIGGPGMQSKPKDK